MPVSIKRIYAPQSPQDGFRILVDRLWPRGIRKEEAGIDLWLKEIAPSDGLRRIFGHDATNFEAFSAAYKQELIANAALPELLKLLEKHDAVTLLFAAKDEYFNNATVLLEVIEDPSPDQVKG